MEKDVGWFYLCGCTPRTRSCPMDRHDGRYACREYPDDFHEATEALKEKPTLEIVVTRGPSRGPVGASSRLKLIKAAPARQQPSTDCHTIPCCTSDDCGFCWCRRNRVGSRDFNTCG